MHNENYHFTMRLHTHTLKSCLHTRRGCKSATSPPGFENSRSSSTACELLVDGNTGTVAASDLDECTNNDDEDVPSEQKLVLHGAFGGAVAVVVDPHHGHGLAGVRTGTVGGDLQRKQCTEESTDETDEVTEEGNRHGNDECNQASPEDGTATPVSHCVEYVETLTTR